MLSVVKLLLKGEVGVCTLNSHGNDIVEHGKSWKNYEIVFLISVGTLFLTQVGHAKHKYFWPFHYLPGAKSY